MVQHHVGYDSRPCSLDMLFLGQRKLHFATVDLTSGHKLHCPLLTTGEVPTALLSMSVRSPRYRGIAIGEMDTVQ